MVVLCTIFGIWKLHSLLKIAGDQPGYVDYTFAILRSILAPTVDIFHCAYVMCIMWCARVVWYTGVIAAVDDWPCRAHRGCSASLSMDKFLLIIIIKSAIFKVICGWISLYTYGNSVACDEINWNVVFAFITMFVYTFRFLLTASLSTVEGTMRVLCSFSAFGYCSVRVLSKYPQRYCDLQ